jgi:MarR family transcriptional regulator, lower aerobic nicotinate degradation pathway regulator
MRKAERADVGKLLRGRDLPPLLDAASLVESRAHPPEVPAGSLFSQQTLWYRLMKLTNLFNRPFFSRFAKRYHLSINDARILITLASMPEAASHELCDATGMHPMNVSRSVAMLRRQGRIAERRDPENRRRKMLRLTPKGWTVCQAFMPDMNKMADFLFSSLSPLEVEFLSKLVDLLTSRLEAVGDELARGPVQRA